MLFGLELLSAQSKELILNEIKSEYKTTRSNLETYKKNIVEHEGESTDGGQTTTYFKNADIKLIEVIGFWETGKNVTEYYFKNDQLFFVFDQRHKYNRPIHWDEKSAKENGDNEIFDPNKTKITEDRYYFDKEYLFLWLDNDRNKVDLTIGTNTIVGKGLVAHAYKLKSEFKK